jgi:hypothetical protein
MLRAVYPEHKWLPWKFSRVPLGSLIDAEVIKLCLNFIESEFEIKSPGDWYTVSLDDLKAIGVQRVFEKTGGLARALSLYRPEFNWELDRFPSSLWKEIVEKS